jgi:chaperonin GroES
MSKLIPINGYVVLRPVEEEEQMYGNIVIPDLGKEKPEMGEVVATSGTYNYHSDKLIPSNLTLGDKVLIPKLGSLRVTVEGEEYFICKEQDVYAVFKNMSTIADMLKETEVEDSFKTN